MVKARTAWALGAPNLLRVLAYRMGVMTGLNPVRRLQERAPSGDFFLPTLPRSSVVSWLDKTPWLGRYFGYVPYAADSVPDWHSNLLTGVRMTNSERNWWEIPDFDPAVGDIKAVWEASRFDWVPALAQKALAGESGALDKLNAWLNDWCMNNPPYKGPNWKCGQEASIRVMHLALAAILLQQVAAPPAALLDLLRIHLRRIVPTIRYAIAQDNNHGTSEAAALFIGGSWLRAHGEPDAVTWMRLGRKWLENRAKHLIGEDGSFSQYSLNYHRVMLDTFSLAELWRRQLSLVAFSARWYSRASAATHWLHAFIDPATGDGPNLGANDGARLLPLTQTDYRDYRPAVQLAMALFTDTNAYPGNQECSRPLLWLGLDLPSAESPAPRSRVFDEGGYAILRSGQAMAMLRYPRFRFRPSQADALHLDLWLEGRNLLRDAGTYSYNTESAWLSYFPGTASHNTIQFDGRDQMPRLSRFLFGDWLKATQAVPLTSERALEEMNAFSAAYTDGYGARHKREVALFPDGLKVIDEISGFSASAVLRWRLEPGSWVLDGNTLKGERGDVLIFESSMPILRIELTIGWESRYYLAKEEVPVIEIEVGQAGILKTDYRWAR
ncbi:heparinase II/III family protein [Pseudomonas aeruginosa]